MRFLFCLTGVFLLLWPSAARADIYFYVDEAGVQHFTNAPQDTRYRLLFKGSRPKRAGTALAGYDTLIQSAAQRYALDPLLIKAVIKVESGFDSQARSHKGALGLMQLMPGTARDMRVSNPFDPAQNIHGGSRYLRQMYDTFGDLRLALAAYNAGPERVRAAGAVPGIPETVEYVDRVMRLYSQYRNVAAN